MLRFASSQCEVRESGCKRSEVVAWIRQHNGKMASQPLKPPQLHQQFVGQGVMEGARTALTILRLVMLPPEASNRTQATQAKQVGTTNELKQLKNDRNAKGSISRHNK